MKVDGVFAGGGVKAFSFIGAVQVMEEKGFEFDHVAGTSAGSLVAALIKSGYTSEELYSLLDELDVETFKDERMSLLPFPIAKWIHLYFKFGLYRGDALEKWLKEALAKKGVRTFADLPNGSLKLIASDLTRGRLVVLPDDLKRYGVIAEKFSVARAVRMSCSIPFFFEPVKIYSRGSSRKPSYVVDGGILSNFPMFLFRNGKIKKYRKPVIGFQLTPEINLLPKNKMNNAIDMYRALFETMSNAHDLRYIDDQHAKNVVFIPVIDVKATDFELTDGQKKELVHLGRDETEQFLRSWAY
ncbi:patatin-like phospholipase family protein [Halalkalibacter sp. APA_J-10(15)]|uniref:patatin-like phospholipase family protein n=1 Tax=Halalkalibacter sp. APA_J-10(15) TaxID=2933805 RepID=UPI001FF58272|nr:patatin-like phospholipase family protein [Halalkalibacter sp. APA_J-10(15)]MCK0472570.1 patatin-like phospholipase family protein [Halalkalibacter sp. APA_J-10(15)]